MISQIQIFDLAFFSSFNRSLIPEHNFYVQRVLTQFIHDEVELFEIVSTVKGYGDKTYTLDLKHVREFCPNAKLSEVTVSHVMRLFEARDKKLFELYRDVNSGKAEYVPWKKSIYFDVTVMSDLRNEGVAFVKEREPMINDLNLIDKIFIPLLLKSTTGSDCYALFVVHVQHKRVYTFYPTPCVTNSDDFDLINELLFGNDNAWSSVKLPRLLVDIPILSALNNSGIMIMVVISFVTSDVPFVLLDSKDIEQYRMHFCYHILNNEIPILRW